jgi:hypothetical protein
LASDTVALEGGAAVAVAENKQAEGAGAGREGTRVGAGEQRWRAVGRGDGPGGATSAKKRFYIAAHVRSTDRFAADLPEWIEYHKQLGVEHFYTYDCGSGFLGFRAILKGAPFVKRKGDAALRRQAEGVMALLRDRGDVGRLRAKWTDGKYEALLEKVRRQC